MRHSHSLTRLCEERIFKTYMEKEKKESTLNQRRKNSRPHPQIRLLFPVLDSYLRSTSDLPGWWWPLK